MGRSLLPIVSPAQPGPYKLKAQSRSCKLAGHSAVADGVPKPAALLPSPR